MPQDISANKRIAKNTIFLSIRMVIVLLVNLYTTRVVLQALGVVDYGVYNVVCGFVAMFGFVNTSMSNGIQRFFNFEYGKNGEKGARKVYGTSLYIQGVLALITIALIEFVGWWYFNNKIVIPVERITAGKWIFQFSILTLLAGIVQAPFSAAVTAHEKMNFYAVLSVIDVIFKLGCAYAVKYMSGDRLVIYGALIATISCFNLIIYVIYCKKNFREITFDMGLDKKLFMKMFGFSGWNLFGTFSNVIENQGINLLLNFFFGPIVNAARGVATQVNGGIQNFVSNITMPARPQVIQSYAMGITSRTINLTFSVSKVSSLIILTLAIPISLEIDFILHLWLGNNVPEHTDVFTILIISTSFFNTLQSSLSTIVHATGKMKKYQLSCSAVRVSSIIIAFIAVHFYKTPEIPMLVVLVLTMLVLVVSLLIVHQLIDMSVEHYFKEIILPLFFLLIFSLAILMPIHSFLSEGFGRFIIVLVLNTILVCTMSFNFVFSNDERALIRLVFNSMINNLKIK